MHRIDAEGNVGNLFSDGDPALGIPGTKVDAEILNAIQEELCNLLGALGVTLIKGTNDQLATAFGPNVVSAAGIIDLTMTGPGNTQEVSKISESNLGTPFMASSQVVQVPFARAMVNASYISIPVDLTQTLYGKTIADADVISVLHQDAAYVTFACKGTPLSGTRRFSFVVIGYPPTV